jgi:carboxypeptidase Q
MKATIFVILLVTLGSFAIKDFTEDVLDHAADAAKIIAAATTGPRKGLTFDRLAYVADTFGPRMIGSQNIKDATDYILTQLELEGFDNVHLEEVKVPHWVRGRESCELITPRRKHMAILALGTSVGTSPDGILAPVLVVRSFDELHNRSNEAYGKIVVYNQPWISYGASVAYRTNGASEAAKYGAIAALVRSVTPLSINSPHTGVQHYATNVTQIPVASITVEDAEMLWRMQKRGQSPMVHLKMEARNLGETRSHNIVADLKGTLYPEEIVLVSGHIDSWDVGQGAMDDGGGAFVAYNTISLLKYLGLRAKRTIRMVMWTAEEFGIFGGDQYFARHKDEILKNFVMVEESDMGVFKPKGIAFSGSSAAKSVIQGIVGLLGPLNATMYFDNAECPDLGLAINSGVPAASLQTANERYFYFHHSEGDTMSVLNPDDLDAGTAVTSVLAYIVADLDKRLPK